VSISVQHGAIWQECTAHALNAVGEGKYCFGMYETISLETEDIPIVGFGEDQGRGTLLMTSGNNTFGHQLNMGQQKWTLL
jgi:hypothetical protein